jgi:vitamin B12 transporter
MRGANSNQTLFLVDGMRINDPNTDYQVFLGGACVSACDNLEVAHGPQSTLYGGEAVGGVISLRSQRGVGEPSEQVAIEAGSFGTVQGAVSAQGESGATAYNFSAQGGHTDNERSNNAFDSANVSLRLDRTVNERTAVGGTVRWFYGDYENPGDRHTNDPDNGERESNLIATAFAETKIAHALMSRVMIGGQDRRFVSENPRAAGPTQITLVKNRRAVLDWQNTFTGIERHRIIGGITAEANRTRNTGFGDINKKQTLLAVFAQDEFAVTDVIHVTGGFRWDDYDSFGEATTGKIAAAWLVAQERLKLRASYSTAFRSPSFLDLYGQSAFYVGNPALRPERARSWDAGFDYYLPEWSGKLSATWFETNYRDLITYDFGVFPGTVINVERAKTRGVEFAAQATAPVGLDVRVAYTYLEADNLTLGTRLLRRPRHSANADVWREFGGGFSLGAGVAFVSDRRDVDAATFATIDGEDYTVARVYAAWDVNERLTVKARIENLLDENYEEVNGFPAIGAGAYAGVTWKF